MLIIDYSVSNEVNYLSLKNSHILNDFHYNLWLVKVDVWYNVYCSIFDPYTVFFEVRLMPWKLTNNIFLRWLLNLGHVCNTG